ncbi:transglutaminase-like cysteine peptidase [Jiella sp. MQZ9-1]|uniref:Transglutaminase-like cysteine peptidase n=1 Tax=Jiella flava TaxID=2816857 RepID=A0A939FYJ1_9HYPH|nr:transglutaminase-like cysteine peptidase [Jiella flava]MBO0664373.1 transglutaminase-like cysteine peptidase [Jiella flava]MCD2473008.1 transglutaminase-like cysteine peptidase [Jiella flava]
MVGLRAIGATLFLCLLLAGQQSPAAAVEQAGRFMQVGVSAPRPIGHQDFCKRYPSECRPTPGHSAPQPLNLTPELIHKIAAINLAVNAGIRAESDEDLYGVKEYWAYPKTAGDCEDYALLKRRRLHEEAGIDYDDLLLTVVRKQNGEGHAVLTLHSTAGDFILDNLNWRILPWTQTPYTYLKRQSEHDPGGWNRITNGHEILVGALKR